LDMCPAELDQQALYRLPLITDVPHLSSAVHGTTIALTPGMQGSPVTANTLLCS
jgi:hypothetical protein